MTLRRAATLFSIVPLLTVIVRADDWPQWLGPQRDSVWREEGIVESIPEDGLPVKWRVKVGLGYAGPAVADGRVYVTDYVRESGRITNNPGTRDELKGVERVLCLDAETGEEIWSHGDERAYALSYPTGPRCTPTVDGDHVYTLGAMGHLLCLRTSDGEVVWSKSLTDEYQTEVPIWGFSSHPLVHGDLLYCVVGGQGSVAVAFDKRTGKEVWRALSAPEPGYCPPQLVKVGETEQIVIWHPKSINGLDPKTGKVAWSVPLEPSYSMSIATPIQVGNVLFATGMGNACAAIELNDDATEAEVLWRGNARTGLSAANATPVIDDGVVFGSDVQSGAMIAARLSDGERLWQSHEPTGGDRNTRHATVFAVRQGDRHVLFNEKGDLILAKLSAERFEEIGRFHVLDPTTDVFRRKVVWSHPAFAMKSMFARSDEELVRVDLSAR